MRGKVLSAPTVTLPSGITPAHAGKSYLCCGMVLPGWDHPRTCGEKKICSIHGCILVGSPPHMRGKAVNFAYRLRARGITPAHAGKSFPYRIPRLAGWDHPRTCGEKCAIEYFSHSNQGSPPHMRGKVRHNRARGTHDGITPAHAGKRRCVQIRG